MKIVLIGAHGTIGSKVASYLGSNHNLVTAGRNSGDLRLNLEDESSIVDMYNTVTGIDAVVCIAGEAKWAPFADISVQDYEIGIRSKLMGQVNLVRLGQHKINPGGSFTLTSGILADDPVPMTTSAAMVNGAIHSFVRAAALELTNDRRINAVSAGLVEDSAEKYRDFFPGHNPVPIQQVVNAYVKSIAGKMSGQIIRMYH